MDKAKQSADHDPNGITYTDEAKPISRRFTSGFIANQTKATDEAISETQC